MFALLIFTYQVSLAGDTGALFERIESNYSVGYCFQKKEVSTTVEISKYLQLNNVAGRTWGGRWDGIYLTKISFSVTKL